MFDFDAKCLYTPKLESLLEKLNPAEKDAFESATLSLDFVETDSDKKDSWINICNTIALGCLVEAAKIDNEKSDDISKSFPQKFASLTKKEREVFDTAFLVLELAKTHWPDKQGLKRVFLAVALLYDYTEVYLSEL